MLRALYAAAADVAADPYPRHSGRTDAERAAAAALRSNLRAVVLDEADRLLRTEAVAREAAALAARRVAERRDGPAPRRGKGPRPAVARPTQTELLLRDLPAGALAGAQVVCASATVGRTLRRQLMGILGAKYKWMLLINTNRCLIKTNRYLSPPVRRPP
jgi:hypothetical protein